MKLLLPVAAVFVVAATLVLGVGAAPSAADCTTSCGAPSCWNATVRERPDMIRTASVSCSNVESARLVSGPAHSQVSNITTDWYGLHFDSRPDSDAPRWDAAVFELTGPGGTTQQNVQIEVVPRSENSPPICEGDAVSQRSDGSGPVTVRIHPYCRDPDGDDFVMEGGPPGQHPEAPKSVPAGSSESNWTYRTATSSGTETSTVWATDSLGARSNDAQLTVTVGPGVGTPPSCAPNPEFGGQHPLPIYSRAGMTRRFGLVCTDAEGDPFASVLSTPPTNGAIPLFVQDAPAYGFWGVERWVDAMYVPLDSSTAPDPFSVTSAGTDASTTTDQMAIVPEPFSKNLGGACGYSATTTAPGVPGVVKVTCEDDEGDPLSAQVLSTPQHGSLTSPVITPARFGDSDITMAYVPDPGYEGYDCVKVRVTDGYGLSMDMAVDIWVKTPPVPVDPPPVNTPPVDPPPVDTPPVDPPATGTQHPAQPSSTVAGTSVTPPAPVLPPLTAATLHVAPSVRDVAREALGTKSIRRLYARSGVYVWARKRLSRRPLVRSGAAPGMFVICPGSCQIRAGSFLANGTAAIRASRRREVLAAAPGQPEIVALTLAAAERRALRRARKPRAKFTLAIRPDRAPGSKVARTIPVVGPRLGR